MGELPVGRIDDEQNTEFGFWYAYKSFVRELDKVEILVANVVDGTPVSEELESQVNFCIGSLLHLLHNQPLPFFDGYKLREFGKDEKGNSTINVLDPPMLVCSGLQHHINEEEFKRTQERIRFLREHLHRLKELSRQGY